MAQLFKKAAETVVQYNIIPPLDIMLKLYMLNTFGILQNAVSGPAKKANDRTLLWSKESVFRCLLVVSKMITHNHPVATNLDTCNHTVVSNFVLTSVYLSRECDKWQSYPATFVVRSALSTITDCLSVSMRLVVRARYRFAVIL